MKLGKFTLAWDWQHSAVVIGSAAGGAVVNYLETQPVNLLLTALLSFQWSQEKPFVFGSLYAAAAAVLALAKHTFISVTPPISPDSVQRGTVDVPKPTSFLPPAIKRTAMGVAVVVFAAYVVAACSLLTSTKFPQDILAEYTCVQTQVEAGDTNPVSIVAACALQEEQIVLDAMTALLGSASWRAAHPAEAAKIGAIPGVHWTRK
jgi:hypothetical protein